MGSVPLKVASRLSAGLKQFQPILASARSRDVNEADTVVLVTDVLHAVFGYDKYSELTREYAIRGTFCDLAIKLDGTLTCLIEVKAIGLDLKDAYIKQAVDYAANQGVDWVFLTNGAIWRAYRVGFTKPITQELVVEVNLLDLNPRTDASAELLYLLSKEGWFKARLAEHQTEREALSRFTIGALLISEPVLEILRRELRRISPNVKVDVGQIRDVLTNEVLKREVMDGDKAVAAKRLVARSSSKQLRRARDSVAPVCEAAPTPGAPPSLPA